MASCCHCLGDAGPLRYKKSRTGTHPIDHAAAHVLRTGSPARTCLEFSPWGYDERQFCSPGINLPMGRLTRTPNGEFDEYHTSGDNPDSSLRSVARAGLARVPEDIRGIEGDRRYTNLSPKGEPQLGPRGLYRTTGGHYTSVPDRQMALLWLLNQSDARTSVVEIAEKSGLAAGHLVSAAAELVEAGLLVADSDE